MKLFSKKNKTQPVGVQTSTAHMASVHPFSVLDRYSPQSVAELELYTSLREAVPVIDAAIGKMVRLIGDFEVKVSDERFQLPLDKFISDVRCGGGGIGFKSFIYAYFDQLLTYGTAVGEMIPDLSLKGVAALYNASLKDVAVSFGENPMELVVCRRDVNITPVERQNLVFATLLSPEAGTAHGTSVMKGLPFVSSILLKIFGSIGNNFERVGNIRYAVTYNPGEQSGVGARQRAKEIAAEWSRAMRDEGRICDFVAVGDVKIKAIGADNQILDCDVPIRHILEQIVSKLSIPPFLLGLSWSSTERMSAVQADILTSELEYYRTLLTPVIKGICETQLRFLGCDGEISVDWSNISLQDEVELAEARLKNAQAQQIENTLEAVEV